MNERIDFTNRVIVFFPKTSSFKFEKKLNSLVIKNELTRLPTKKFFFAFENKSNIKSTKASGWLIDTFKGSLIYVMMIFFVMDIVAGKMSMRFVKKKFNFTTYLNGTVIH